MIYIQAFNVGMDVCAEGVSFELRDSDDNLIYTETNYVIRNGMGTVHLEIPNSGFKGSVWIMNADGIYIDVSAINAVDVMQNSIESSATNITVVDQKGDLIPFALVELYNGNNLIQGEITGSDGIVMFTTTNGMTIRISAQGYVTQTRVISSESKYIPVVLNEAN